MNLLFFKQRLIIIIIALGLALIAIFTRGLYSPTPPTLPWLGQHTADQPTTPSTVTVIKEVGTKDSQGKTDKVQVVSSKPSPLEEAIVVPTQTIEITFSQPLENVGEFKYRLDPKPQEAQVELSSDRKTAKIIPIKPFTLGARYTLFITTDTKFDGRKVTQQDLIFHFSVIPYQGV